MTLTPRASSFVTAMGKGRARTSLFIRLLVFMLLGCMALGLEAGDYSAASRPRFEAFAVPKEGPRKTAPLRLSKEDRCYRTRLRAGAQEVPNFAGHFIVAVWGCGASCQMGAAIDAKTGRVHWLPGTVCCWDSSVEEDPTLGAPILFRPDSRLMILSGYLDEKGIKGTHYFEFTGGRFVHLLTVPSVPVE